MLLPTRIQKALMILGLVAFLSLGFLSMSHSSMAMGEDGNMTMTNCLLMSEQAVVCNMNPLEHIAAWQSMFTSTPSQNGSMLVLLFLAALALALVWTRSLWPPPEKTSGLGFRFVCREEHLPPPLLQELFSNGILNPKLF